MGKASFPKAKQQENPFFLKQNSGESLFTKNKTVGKASFSKTKQWDAFPSLFPEQQRDSDSKSLRGNLVVAVAD